MVPSTEELYWSIIKFSIAVAGFLVFPLVYWQRLSANNPKTGGAALKSFHPEGKFEICAWVSQCLLRCLRFLFFFLRCRLVLSRHLFIPFRIGIWEGDQCPQSLLERTIFFRPSLGAPRTHQILPINHSANKRSDWLRVCLCCLWKLCSGFSPLLGQISILSISENLFTGKMLGL